MMIFQEAANKENVVGVVDGFIERIKKRLALTDQKLAFATNVGVTCSPDHGIVMYKAEGQSKGNSPSHDQPAHAGGAKQPEVGTGLRRALERGELEAYYQPILNANNGRITGIEALVRWWHPEKGLITPSEFIKLAEENGMILPVDEWVLRTACTQNNAWLKAGIPPLRISVNISAHTFQRKNLLDFVAQVLEETGMDPRSLCLEVTESVAMQEIETSASGFSKLSEMGVNIFIDDLGTGSSSFGYLKKFPINMLKIDQSIVQDIATNPHDAEIVKSIIAVAKDMGLKVVAEGVETDEQFTCLKELHCDEVQGFLFSKPVPALTLERMLEREK